MSVWQRSPAFWAEEYANRQTRTGQPRNRQLIANISELRLAILHDLWQEPEPFPDPEQPRWWEVWLARVTREDDPSSVLRAIAAQREWSMVSDKGIELLGRPDPRAARLFVISAGNVRRDQHGQADHLAVSDTSRVQSPAQAWNALTVGAYTDLTQPPTDPMFRGWRTVAPGGELSPFSRTSMLFPRAWPIKPDIVLEGGNLLTDGNAFDQHDDASLLTTSNRPHALLTTVNAHHPGRVPALRGRHQRDLDARAPPPSPALAWRAAS